MTHDTTYAEMEAALRDWLFGCNPWGTSMIVGYPREGDTPVDPHSAFTHLSGYPIDGGLVDGPFAAANLIGVRLQDPDEYAEFQSRLVVYHDDMGDYSTNEPTMDGTASLTYYLSSMEMDGRGSEPGGEPILSHGGIVRMDPSKREIFLGYQFYNIFSFTYKGGLLEKAMRPLRKNSYNLGSITAALQRLRQQCTITELREAVDEALARAVPHPNAVRLALERHREQRGQPPATVVTLPEHVQRRDVLVTPNPLDTYDQLTEHPDDDPQPD